MVSAIKIRINSCFYVANNVVPVEDVMNMHNVDNNLTESERHNVRIWCHYIVRDLKIRLENLNEVKNGFTWIKCFTQGCHNMSKVVIFKIINGKTV